MRGALSPDSTPTLAVAGIPLVVIVFVIVRDLSRRSTGPTALPVVFPSSTLKVDPVKVLSGQLRVAAKASDSYFENVVRTRLRELLISKVALETGLEREQARRILLDSKLCQTVLRNQELYEILFRPVPRTSMNRMKMIDRVVEMIGEWQA